MTDRKRLKRESYEEKYRGETIMVEKTERENIKLKMGN